MASTGYQIFLLRASVYGRPRELQRLSSVGDEGIDLSPAFGQAIAMLGDAYHSDNASAEGYRLKQYEETDRSHFFRINKGPIGSRGEAYDIETGESIETTERQALLSGLRGWVTIPEDSFYGFLFVERIGRRHLRDLFHEVAIKPVAQTSGAILRLESFAPAASWRSELANMEALRVSEVLHATDSGEDLSTANDSVIRIVAEGARVKKASDAVIGAILNRVDRREADFRMMARASRMLERRRAQGNVDASFGIQDLEEYEALVAEVEHGAMDASSKLEEALQDVLPAIQESGLQRKRIDVSVGPEDRVKRTFSVERDTIPAFVFETAGILQDRALRETWEHHATELFRLLGE